MKKNLFLSLFLAFLFACSSAVDEKGYTKDPLEGFNRGVYAFNDTIDTVALKPVARGYEVVVPKVVRKGVTNFFGNLDDVKSLLNATLQFEGKQMAGISARIIDNTFFGLGGLIDVATPMGNPKIKKDFGSTLAHYGVQSGPFIMLPLLGPSTVRDAVGKVPDTFMSPMTYVDDKTYKWVMVGTDVINTRANLLPMERQMEGISNDKYATVRDAWLQNRWAELGTPINELAQEDIDDIFTPSAEENASPQQ